MGIVRFVSFFFLIEYSEYCEDIVSIVIFLWLYGEDFGWCVFMVYIVGDEGCAVSIVDVIRII